QRESAGGESQRTDRESRSVRGQRDRGTGCGAGNAGADSGREPGDRRRRQGLRHAGFRGRVSASGSDAACGAEPGTARGSAIDGRTTHHPGYHRSQKKRKRIEECFGWLKTIALLRKVRHRGVCKVDWIFTFACAAYNLVRMRNLAAAVSRVGAEVCPVEHLVRPRNSKTQRLSNRSTSRTMRNERKTLRRSIFQQPARLERRTVPEEFCSTFEDVL